MAEFITKCPHCQNDLRVEDEWDGMDVDCPICSKTFTVRKPSEKRVKNNSRTSSAHKYYCSNCKKEYPEPVKFCSECSSKIQNKSSNGAKKAAHAIRAKEAAHAILLFAFIIGMGWRAVKKIWLTPEETVKTISSNTADSSSEKSHQTHESKISVYVTVKKWMSNWDEEWRYSCEYRLYADDQLIATKNSTSTIVQFKV